MQQTPTASRQSIQNQTMNTKPKTLGRVAAVLAFASCLLGGVWILAKTGFASRADGVWTGLGLYFVGKPFFVGPMLLVAGEQLGNRQEGR